MCDCQPPTGAFCTIIIPGKSPPSTDPQRALWLPTLALVIMSQSYVTPIEGQISQSDILHSDLYRGSTCAPHFTLM